jgi:hypothetical protein
VAIRDQYNVSSITDNGTGNYTVNFTSAMSNANYTHLGTGEPTSSFPSATSTLQKCSGGTYSTSAFQVIATSNQSGAATADSAYCFCAFFSN